MEMGLILFKSLIELELHHLRQVRYHDEFSGQVFVQCHTSLRELKDAEVRGLPHFPHEAHPDADIRTEVSDFLQEPFEFKNGDLVLNRHFRDPIGHCVISKKTMPRLSFKMVSPIELHFRRFVI